MSHTSAPSEGGHSRFRSPAKSAKGLRERAASRQRSSAARVQEVVRRSVFRAIRAVKILAQDNRIPRPLRWLGVVGLLPISGPVDEGVLLVVAGLLAALYPDRMREAWRVAANERVTKPS